MCVCFSLLVEGGTVRRIALLYTLEQSQQLLAGCRSDLFDVQFTQKGKQKAAMRRMFRLFVFSGESSPGDVL